MTIFMGIKQPVLSLKQPKKLITLPLDFYMGEGATEHSLDLGRFLFRGFGWCWIGIADE